ncbi:histidine kinase [Streptomyces sp. B6B3]|uniref:sensor histidine kinase n=1 Tax=Streptomyces sp. B6B3 TaxID=3153570 RepID=UPI00325CDFA9
MFARAFAFRPLPPLTNPPAWLKDPFPARLRPYLAWLPHAAVVLAALVLMQLTGWRYRPYYAQEGEAAISALWVGVPLILVLFRPMVAWWLSLAGSVYLALWGLTEAFPWTPGGLISHLLVMALVALRERPRVAVEMWLFTTAVGVFFDASEGRPSNAPVIIIASAVVLLGAVLTRGWWESRQEVVKQTAVTVRERSQRTLLEERTTIARELHDVVAHHMSVVAIQAEAAPYRVTDPDPELVRSFATIRENALLALTELRRVLGVVRAADYEAPDAPQPTLAALDGLLDNVRDAGLNVEKIVTGAVRELPQGIELSAYRIVQEALSNVLRHAPGADTRVEISYVLGGLGLRIVNGPPRDDVPPSPGSGNGLTGMRERVTMLDGHISTQPTDDGGYETTVFLPVPAADPQDV